MQVCLIIDRSPRHDSIQVSIIQHHGAWLVMTGLD